MRFGALDAARAVGGRLVGPDVAIDGVSFDSRSLQPGQLFVPLVAERDGHDFIAMALERGAAAYLTSRPARGGPNGGPGTGTAIEVVDTLQALMVLAADRARRSPATVIGVTGSVGKTSPGRRSPPADAPGPTNAASTTTRACPPRC
jgi:UDP-N-acetylmuramoyl-tripeptide--D-alanyl-D-alanine ligase